MILFNYAHSCGYDVGARADLSAFPDAGSVSGWAQDALSWANAAGLINGTVYGGRTILDPQGSASRAQVAMILMNYVVQLVLDSHFLFNYHAADFFLTGLDYKFTV